jgi:hypothetical protein
MGDAGEFQVAGRTLFSLGLIKGAEGNLSVYRDGLLRITRTGSRLDRLEDGDIVAGELGDDLPGASGHRHVHVRPHPPGGGRRPGAQGPNARGDGVSAGGTAAAGSPTRRPPQPKPASEGRTPRPGRDRSIAPVEWLGDRLRLLDQTVLPGQERPTAVVIERRSPQEVSEPLGTRIAPEGTSAVNRAFDVTRPGW